MTPGPESAARAAPRRSRKMPKMSRPAVPSPATIEAFKAILGPGGWLDAAPDRAPFETDFRRLHQGRDAAGRPPRLDGTGGRARRVLCARTYRDRAAGRQHQLLRRCDAAAFRQRDPAFAAPPAENPLGRRAERLAHRRSGLRARGTAIRGRRRQSPAADVARLRGQRDARRHRLDQRRRHGGVALWNDACARARARSGAAGRQRARPVDRAAQGQHRLRPEAAIHWRRGHARRRDRRDAAAVSASGGRGDGIRRARLASRRAGAARDAA